MKFLVSFLSIFLATIATTRAESSRMLSLEDCIKLAIEHNLGIQIARLNPDLATFDLRATYGSYEPALSLGGTHSYEETPFATKGETDSLRGGIGGFLPWGTTYDLGLRMSDNYGSVSNLTTFEGANANGGLFSVRQPLLKDFWTDSTRLTIFINRNNLKSSDLSLRDQIMSTITAVERAYYNVIFAEENVRVQEKALELAEQLVTDNRRRVQLGALAPLDEKQAESQAAASRANLVDSRAAREAAQRTLKSLMSDNYKEWIEVKVQPSESLTAIPQKFDLFASWRKGEVSRPDLLIARLGLENQDQRVRLARNQKLPSLDVVGGAGYIGEGDEFSSAFRDIRRKDYPYYSYGVEVTIPLGNTVARNRYKSEKTVREQEALRYKQTEQLALISIENSISEAQTSLERVEATRQARLYAEDALKAEQTKLEKGKSTSFIVLQLQRELTAARSAEIRALADYNIALAELAYNEGSTLERRKIDLKVK
jgi:outer membrane protein TolC